MSLSRIFFGFVILTCAMVVFAEPESKTMIVPIYNGVTGELMSKFETWGWGKFNLKDKTMVRKGSNYAISFECKGYSAIYLAGDFGYAAKHVDSISFSINGGNSSGAKVALVVEQNYKPAGEKLDISNMLEANVWKDITIDFSKFNIGGENASKIVDALWFQAASEDYTGTIYIDNITVQATRKWNLVWSDEFDTFNDKVWTALTGTHGSSSNEKEYYIPDEVSTSDGKLILRTRENTPSQNKIYNYTSGWIDSKGKWSHTFGRWEIYAKLPGTWAIWPAHWLMPDDGSCWPRHGEIDIMEMIGKDMTTTHGSYHWTSDNSTCYKATLNAGSLLSTGFNLSLDYHLYAIEWDKDSIGYTFDNVHFHTNRNKGYPGWKFPDNAVPTSPHHWILNTALGGSWPGMPDKRTVLPVYHYIDYVKVYDPVD